MKNIYFILLSLPVFCSFHLFKVAPLQEKLSEDIIQTTYLFVLGRFPLEREKNKFLLYTEQELPGVIDQLMETKEFYTFMESKLRYELLEGTSDELIINTIFDYYFLYMTKQGSMQLNYFQKNFENLNYLGAIITQSPQSSVSIKDIQIKLVSNSIYENINMGANNFAISTFQNFFNRKPTQFELEQSINIIEGKFGILFNQIGRSKSDYLAILFNSNSFKEAQINYWFEYINNTSMSADNYTLILNLTKHNFTAENIIKQTILLKCLEN
jgi:hypothetical protein